MSLADNHHETSRVIRGWHLVVEAFAAIGTLLIGVLMLIICADIVARNLMGASLPLVSEGGALLVVTLVALQLAATVRAGRLARAEFFLNAVENRSPRAAAYGANCAAISSMSCRWNSTMRSPGCWRQAYPTRPW